MSTYCPYVNTYIIALQPNTQNKLAMCQCQCQHIHCPYLIFGQRLKINWPYVIAYCLIYHILSMYYVQAIVKAQNKSSSLYVGHCLLVSNSKKCIYQKCTTIHIKKCTYQHKYHLSKEHRTIFNHQLQQVLVWTCQVPTLMQHHSQVLKTKKLKKHKSHLYNKTINMPSI